MKINFFASILLFVCSISLASAQETDSKDLSYLFPQPKSWDFGIQIMSGVEESQYTNQANRDFINEPYFVGRLGFFAQYNLTKKSSLRSEISAGAFSRLAPTLSFQYGYNFAPRWTAYGGIGLDIDFNNQAFSPERDAEQRLINPRLQLGVRYQATKSLFFDLRYEQDMLDRTKRQDLSNSIGKFKTISLGAGFKF
ncbi:outer membrane protein [Nonlabens sp. Asnod2-A12]|uniref:outer membrane protein n=1 Tax=Nonlabens sp. Asnod2-A12 TaxID=3160578 RepID=UPI003868004D